MFHSTVETSAVREDRSMRELQSGTIRATSGRPAAIASALAPERTRMELMIQKDRKGTRSLARSDVRALWLDLAVAVSFLYTYEPRALHPRIAAAPDRSAWLHIKTQRSE